jgi:hypothetical protein
MIRTLHIRYYEKLHVQYLEMVKSHSEMTLEGFHAKHKPFGGWADVNGYAGFVPSHTYFRGFYDAMIERHAAEIDQHMAMLPARILCIDHSHKVPNHLGKVNGEPTFGGLHTVTNKYGEVRQMTLTPTKAHDQFMPALSIIPHSLRKYGHHDVELVFTDNVHGDKAELEQVFPSLLSDVFPVQSSLPTLSISPEWEVQHLRNAYQVNSRINCLLDDLAALPETSTMTIGMECRLDNWNSEPS